MANLSLRGLDEEIKERLTSEARQRSMSVNALLLELIRRSVGLGGDNDRPCFHDLDELAGTWSADDAADFSAATAMFSAVDDDLWK